MIRLAVTGASGRMGRTLTQCVHEADDLQLSHAVERSDSSFVHADAGELAGVGKLEVPITTVLDAEQFDVLIDFTVPEATLAALDVCVAAGRGVVIGTTGFDAAGLQQIEAASEQVAVFMAPNMSVGVNLVFKLIEIAAQALGDSVDIEVTEAHHEHKIDAPSGTAVRMGEILAQATGRNLADVAVYGREGVTGARARETIGMHSLRAGDIVGDHTVLYAGAGERIEITHRAHSRSNFAQGALRAARFVARAKPGLYNMQQLLGFG